MVVSLYDLYYRMQAMGIFEIALPFLLVFTVVFAILQKARPLGERSKNLNVVVSLIFGLLFVSRPELVSVVNNSLGNVAVVIIGLLAILLLIGVFGGEAFWSHSTISGGLVVVMTLVVIGIFANSAGFISLPYYPFWLDNPDTLAMILLIAVFFLVVYLVTKEEHPTETRPGFLEEFSRMFRPRGGR